MVNGEGCGRVWRGGLAFGFGDTTMEVDDEGIAPAAIVSEHTAEVASASVPAPAPVPKPAPSTPDEDDAVEY